MNIVKYNRIMLLLSSKAMHNKKFLWLNNGYRIFIQTFWKMSETRSHGVIYK